MSDELKRASSDAALILEHSRLATRIAELESLLRKARRVCVEGQNYQLDPDWFTDLQNDIDAALTPQEPK